MADIVRKSAGPLRSAAVAAGGFAYVSGQVADDVSRDAKAQTEEILQKIDGILNDMETSRSNIVFAHVWLADIADYDRMNEAWDAWIPPGEAPARATVEAALPGKQYRVEIMVIARLG